MIERALKKIEPLTARIYQSPFGSLASVGPGSMNLSSLKTLNPI